MLFMTVRTLHILAAIWFTCGVAAYVVTRLTLLKRQDAREVQMLVGLMERFRNLMIRPGGMLLVIFGLWTAYYEAWPRFSLYAIALLIIMVPFIVLTVKGTLKIVAASAAAAQSGAITPELDAAMRDRKLAIGVSGASIITFLFLLLMLIKPA